MAQPSSRPSSTRASRAWLVVPLLLAGTAAALALSLDTGGWMAAFHHPGAPDSAQREALRRRGAVLWPIMLGVSAAALVLVPPLLCRLERGGEPDVGHPGISGPHVPRAGWIVAALIVAGLALRLRRITESLWYDEISALLDYARYGPGAIVGNYFDPANHVGHTLATWAALELLQPMLGRDLALRVPALLGSLALVPAMFLLGRRAAGERAGLVAAGLAAVLPVAVLEGVEARGYSLMMASAALSTWLFMPAWPRASAWRWCLYALVCAAGVWVHPLTAFVPFGHGVWALWRARRRADRRRAAAAWIAAGLAALLSATLYAPLLAQMLHMRGIFEAAGADQPRLLGVEGGHALLQMGGSWSAWGAVPGLLLAGLGAAAYVRRGPARTALALAGLGLPLFVAGVLLGGVWMYARFALFALPAAVLAIALGLECLWSWRRPAALLAGAALLAAIAADLVLRPSKQPLRDAASYVQARGGGRVLVVGLVHRVMDAYAGDLDLVYALRHGRHLDRRLPALQPDWIILYYPRNVEPETYEVIEEAGFVPAARFPGWVDWGNGDVVVYGKRQNVETSKRRNEEGAGRG